MTYHLLFFHSGGGEVVSSIIDTAKKSCSTTHLQINRVFLPIKAMYFFFLAGNASFLPFYSVYMTYLGLSVLQVGIVQGIEPVVQLIIGPLWGTLADKYSKHKTILLVSTIVPVLFFFGTYFVPHVKLPWLPIENATDVSWTETVTTKELSKVEIGMKTSVSTIHMPVLDKRHLYSTIQVEKSNSKVHLWHSNYTEPSNNSGFIFGLMLIFSFFANVFFCPFFPIIDSSTMRLVNEHSGNFGQQRMWGAISWGIFATVSGIAIDNYPVSGYTNKYAPAFYLFALMSVITFFVALRVNFTQHQHQQTVWRGVGSLFLNPYFILFLIATFVSGLSMGILSYLFIFLEELQGSHLLMGLTNALTCSTETPVMYFSNLMIQHLGHKTMLCMIVLCYGVRLMCYSFLQNPWLVLTIEILHGFTFGAFRPTATSYVNVLAPTGLEATVQAIIYGVFSGLGRGVGILVGGVVYHNYGGRTMFRASAVLCGVTFFSLCLFYCILAFRVRRSRVSLQYEAI